MTGLETKIRYCLARWIDEPELTTAVADMVDVVDQHESAVADVDDLMPSDDEAREPYERALKRPELMTE